MIDARGYRRLPDHISIFLDFVRTLAAFLVVYHHAAQHNRDYAVPPLDRLGQEGVIIFFVLSGFVIFSSEVFRSDGLKRYFLRRTLRIYPVLIFAMLLTAVVEFIKGDFILKFSIVEMLGNLLAFQDAGGLKPGVIVLPFMGNSPLWSLSYEIFFYAIFPTVFSLWKSSHSMTSNFVGATCCLAFVHYLYMPSHFSLLMSYFLIWWCGACMGAYYLSENRDISIISIPLMWLSGLTVLAGLGVYLIGYVGLGVFPMLMLRHFLVALGVLLLAFLIPVRAISLRLAIIWRLLALFSSLSYGVYAFHYPILILTGAYSGYLGTFFALILTVALAWIIDRELSGRLKRAVLKY